MEPGSDRTIYRDRIEHFFSELKIGSDRKILDRNTP